MADIYDFNAVERKWQAYWDAHHCFEAEAEEISRFLFRIVRFALSAVTSNCGVTSFPAASATRASPEISMG